GDCLKPFDAVMVTDNSCTVFRCIIRSKLRTELVGIIHRFSFPSGVNFYLCLRFCSGQPAVPADRSDAGCAVWTLASKPADDPGDQVLCNAPSPLAQQHIVSVRWLKLGRGAVYGGERCASFGRRQNVERTRYDKDRRGEFRRVDGKRPARRLVDPQGRFWDEERVEMRGLHVVQALKKHLPSDVGWRLRHV